MSIRWRLTLLFALLLMGIGVVRIGITLGAVSTALGRMAQSDCEVRLLQVQNYLRDLSDERSQKGMPPLDLRSPEALIRAFSDDGLYVSLSDPAGRVLNKSPNLGNQRFPRAVAAGVQEIDLPLPHLFFSPRVLLVTKPLLLSGQQGGWIQVAYPLEDMKRTMGDLQAIELAGWLGAGLVALFAGHVFAGRALAPVVRITEEVNGWTETDLRRRLPMSGRPRDEIDRLATTFNQLFDRLERSFETEQRFVADASHELKSPLTAIRGHLQLIQRLGARDPEGAARWLDVALREVERLTRLVIDLLDSSRTTRAEAQVPLRLDELLKDVVQQFEPLGIPVAWEADPPVTWVKGDVDGLRQVFINLLDNARRATQGGGAVTLRLTHAGSEARVEVKDTGIGIPLEAQARIYDRFFRVDANRSRDAGGSGLGLPIAKSIVQQHGGRIELTSYPGIGTTFTLTFLRLESGAADSQRFLSQLLVSEEPFTGAS
ncbi:MAG TPA: ATP-binding protein [Stenomitos sp.]